MAENDMVVVKEEPKDPEDNDIVTTNSEMVLDDILGDDIIGESSDQETEKGRKKIKAPKSEPAAESSKRSRNNSYASDLSSTGSISKRSSKPVDWHNLEARYFVIKSNNMDNVEISMEKSLWATPRRNEDMLVEAFRHTKHVILIFSVRESGAFQGVARMMSMPKPNKDEVHWIVGSTPVLRLLPNIFKIQWLDRSPLEFTKTTHLKNKWNEWKQVKIARDGTEVEPNCAAQLCSMWTNSEDPDSHIPTITSRHRPSESAARYPKVTSPKRLTSAASCLSGLISNLWRVYVRHTSLLLRTYILVFVEQCNASGGCKMSTQPISIRTIIGI